MDLKESKNNGRKKFVVEFVIKKGGGALDQSRNLIFEREIYRIRWLTWLIPLIVYRFEAKVEINIGYWNVEVRNPQV